MRVLLVVVALIIPISSSMGNTGNDDTEDNTDENSNTNTSIADQVQGTVSADEVHKCVSLPVFTKFNVLVSRVEALEKKQDGDGEAGENNVNTDKNAGEKDDNTDATSKTNTTNVDIDDNDQKVSEIDDNDLQCLDNKCVNLQNILEKFNQLVDEVATLEKNGNTDDNTGEEEDGDKDVNTDDNTGEEEDKTDVNSKSDITNVDIDDNDQKVSKLDDNDLQCLDKDSFSEKFNRLVDAVAALEKNGNTDANTGEKNGKPEETVWFGKNDDETTGNEE